MPIHQQVWESLRQYKTVGHAEVGGVVAVLALVLSSFTLNTSAVAVRTQLRCAHGDLMSSGGLGDRVVESASHQQSADLKRVKLRTCVPAVEMEALLATGAYPPQVRSSQPVKHPQPVIYPQPAKHPQPPTHSRSIVHYRQVVQGGGRPGRGSSNVFPYGQCTWWANQRYFQLHGVYVPWRTGADAWEWTMRAYQFHWHVSSRPSVGAIIDLQPGVQGAYGLGHVAVVERILGNGRVLASTMNWGAEPWKVVYVEYTPGPGVTFITQ